MGLAMGLNTNNLINAINECNAGNKDISAVAKKHGIAIKTLKEALKNIIPPYDNELSFVSERPITLEKLMELYSIDPNKWIATSFKPNTWQSFFKTSNDTAQKVNLYQSKATFRPIVDNHVRVATDWLNENIVPIAPEIIKPLRVDALDGQTVIWGIWDAHLGMYAWNQETNNDYDLNIAIKRIKNSIDDMINDLADYPIKQIILPIGNDFLHFDNARQTTTQGTHHLDADSRYTKVYLAGLECLAYMIERALQLSRSVKILYIPGNHDHLTSYTLCVALQQRYRHYHEIEFDIRPNPRKYVSWGTCIVGFDHSDKVKKNQYPIIFATEPGAKEHISNATWLEVQVGHTHQKAEQFWFGATPMNGLLIRTNPSLCNVDFWHHSQGFLGEPMKSVEAWRYNDYAYIGSHVAWARDD